MEEKSGFTALEHRLEDLAVGTKQKQGLFPGMQQHIDAQSSKHRNTATSLTETDPDVI